MNGTHDPDRFGSRLIGTFGTPSRLAIEAPVIAATNGPAVRHAEIPLVSDIVLATGDTFFQDTAHFAGGMIPGDGMHVVMPLLMGLNRGRLARPATPLGPMLHALPAHGRAEGTPQRTARVWPGT